MYNYSFTHISIFRFIRNFKVPMLFNRKLYVVNMGEDRGGLLLYVNMGEDRGGLLLYVNMGEDRGDLLLYVNMGEDRGGLLLLDGTVLKLLAYFWLSPMQRTVVR